MRKKRIFCVYEMKSDKGGKEGTSHSAPAEPTPEDGSNDVASDAVVPTTAGPTPAPGSATEPTTTGAAIEPAIAGAATESTITRAATEPTATRGATESAATRAVTPPFGISMVHGPPIILDLDLPVDPSPSSGPSSRTPSARHPSPMSYAEILTYVGPTAAHVPLVDARTRSATNSSVHFRSDTPYYRDSSRDSDYSDTGSVVYQREISSPNPSIFTLDREVKHYIKRRESAVYDYYPGTERSDYDYVSERKDVYTTNVLESTAHLIKGSLGGAVLSMHEAYMIGGLWTSLIVTIAVGFLTAYTMLMLIKSAQKLYRRLRINKLSYPDLAEAAAATAPWNWVRNKSKLFRYTVEITLLFQMLGTCCIYQIIISTSMKRMFLSIDPKIYEWIYDVRMYILISVPLLLPLCLIKSLKWLSPFALVADIFVAICVVTTIYYSVLTFESKSILDRAVWKNMHGFFRVWGICMYGTSGICVALPVENNMRTPKYFPVVVRNATIIVTLFSTMTGFFGYWAWGESCTSPITVHMPLNIATTVLQFLLVIMFSITFALTFWVPFRIIWHYLIRKHKSKFSLWERIYRFIMTILVTALSMIAPHTIPVMIFMGQFFLGFVALIFPAFIEFFVDWEDHYASRARVRFAANAKNLGLIILGLILSLTTTYSVRDSH